MTAVRSSENGGRFAGGHFAGGYDGMANLRKPITAYDFHGGIINIYIYSYIFISHALAHMEIMVCPKNYMLNIRPIFAVPVVRKFWAQQA